HRPHRVTHAVVRRPRPDQQRPRRTHRRDRLAHRTPSLLTRRQHQPRQRREDRPGALRHHPPHRVRDLGPRARRHPHDLVRKHPAIQDQHGVAFQPHAALQQGGRQPTRRLRPTLRRAAARRVSALDRSLHRQPVGPPCNFPGARARRPSRHAPSRLSHPPPSCLPHRPRPRRTHAHTPWPAWAPRVDDPQTCEHSDLRAPARRQDGAQQMITPYPRIPAPSPKRSLRRSAALLAAALTAVAAPLSAATPAHAATATFTPVAAWNDTSGNPLQLHGLGIINAGGTWYGFGEDKTGESSSNTAFQDIPCYSSTDLSTWTRQTTALARQSTGDLGPNRIVERPKVLHNPSTGKYVMYLHIDNTSYSEAKVGVAVSDSVCGPYTYQGSFQPLGFQSRDIGLFQDTDGTGYLLSEDRANGLRIDRLSADYLSVASSVALFADYEAPAMVKIGGTYYLLGSHLTGWSTNDNVYATATSLSGPWSSFR